jgi:hypothetical protein
MILGNFSVILAQSAIPAHTSPRESCKTIAVFVVPRILPACLFQRLLANKQTNTRCRVYVHQELRKSLNANTSWAVAHVGSLGLRYRVVIDMDDAIQVARDRTRGLFIRLLHATIEALGRMATLEKCNTPEKVCPGNSQTSCLITIAGSGRGFPHLG